MELILKQKPGWPSGEYFREKAEATDQRSVANMTKRSEHSLRENAFEMKCMAHISLQLPQRKPEIKMDCPLLSPVLAWACFQSLAGMDTFNESRLLLKNRQAV